MNSKAKPKILVVDDQPINIKLLQRKLEQQGLDVLIAYTGSECLEIVQREIPDLILMDVMMPDMDGIETCRQLKAHPETETIPIIFITAKASKEGKLEGLNAGAVDYITKPIDLDETLARVRTQLRLREMFRENLNLQERLGDARKAASIGAITQGIAHNLNNLLGVVVGYLDLIKSNYENTDMVHRSVGLMDNAVNKMVNIIRQLGTIANNERCEMTALPVNKLLDDSIERFRAEYDVGASVLIQNELKGGTMIHANAENFEIILGKLLINAWESYPKSAAPSERKITLIAGVNRAKSPAKLEIKVIDQGGGIAKEVENSLFEPFITTKTSVGRGMGLTISRHTMRNIGGDVQLITNHDAGVTAILTHPLS